MATAAARRDGRTAQQLRPMTAAFGLLRTCDGSARLCVGEWRRETG
jgi:exosome complex RNA-binding protein Rrp42 (RNase PH superfamily)